MRSSDKTIGVLDIQGSVIEHVKVFEELGCDVLRVKAAADLQKIDGLVIPGGESTTIGKLLEEFGLAEKIKQRAKEGMPIWGTCAGAILLANLGLIKIEIERNAYGRQLESFETEVEFDFPGERKKIPAVFIRAPKVKAIKGAARVLAKDGEDIVAVENGKIMITTFHPELTSDRTVHSYFLELLPNSRQ